MQTFIKKFTDGHTDKNFCLPATYLDCDKLDNIATNLTRLWQSTQLFSQSSFNLKYNFLRSSLSQTFITFVTILNSFGVKVCKIKIQHFCDKLSQDYQRGAKKKTSGTQKKSKI